MNTVQVVPQVCDVEVLETVTIPKLTEAQRVQIKLAKNQDINEKDGTIEASRAILDMGLEIIDCVVSTSKQWL